jgi:hypothetical protein
MQPFSWFAMAQVTGYPALSLLLNLFDNLWYYLLHSGTSAGCQRLQLTIQSVPFFPCMQLAYGKGKGVEGFIVYNYLLKRRPNQAASITKPVSHRLILFQCRDRGHESVNIRIQKLKPEVCTRSGLFGRVAVALCCCLS